MRKTLAYLIVFGVIAGAYFVVRIALVLTTANTGAEKVVLLHGFGRSESVSDLQVRQEQTIRAVNSPGVVFFM